MVFCSKYYFFKNYFQFTGSSILGQQNMSGEKGYLMSCENFYMFYDATVVASVALIELNTDGFLCFIKAWSTKWMHHCDKKMLNKK